MMATSAYTRLVILANMKIGMLMFERGGKQLRPQGMKYKRIAQVSNMGQTNHHHCLEQTLYQMYLKKRLADFLFNIHSEG